VTALLGEKATDGSLVHVIPLCGMPIQLFASQSGDYKPGKRENHPQIEETALEVECTPLLNQPDREEDHADR
jgi:hypothetical protein